jgi:hypothetical protein
MNRVKLLFAPENAIAAERLSSVLTSVGYEITGPSAAANAVLVIWSDHAAASPEILSVCRAALARRILIPVSLGKSPPPASFEHLWPMDLSGWSGNLADPRWRFVLDELSLATRRGVELTPPRSPEAGAAQSDILLAPPTVDAKSGPGSDNTDFEEFFPEPQIYHYTARPKPRVPLAAILAGCAVIGVAIGGAFLVGRETAGSIAQPAPVVAFVQPEDPVPEDLDETIDDERAGAVAVNALSAAKGAEDEFPPYGEGDAEFPEDASVAAPVQALREGGLAPVAIPAPLAETAKPLPPTLKGQIKQAEAGIAPNAPADADPIANLAWNATAGKTDAVPELYSSDIGLYLRDCVACPDLAEINRRLDAVSNFAIGVREVTNREWRACVAATACPSLPGEGPDAFPATGVSFADALKFAAWLSGMTGRNYRLPSEEEWMLAAGLSEAPVSAAQANLAIKNGPSRKIAASGSFPPNKYGLFDTAGNVWEWTQACAGASCDQRIIKGGSFNTPAAIVTDGMRVAAPIELRRADTGFRIARDLP